MPNAAPEKIAESYRHCREVARREAKNFFYGFLLLPRAKRDALCALYAFMRGVDDIADNPGSFDEKQGGLVKRREEMDAILRGDDRPGAVWPAFLDTMERYSISPRALHDLISGAEMDQTPRIYETFDDLRQYCYCVAGTVGLACLNVFGFSDSRAPELAEKLGIAFQLTNVLRDVASDLEMDRVYLPREDLLRFDAKESDLRARLFTEEWRSLLEYECERAWQFYAEGWPLIRMVDRDSRPALWALANIYLGIVEHIASNLASRDYDIFAAPVARLSTARKLWILATARFQWSGEVNVLRIGNRGGRRPGGSLVGGRAG